MSNTYTFLDHLKLIILWIVQYLLQLMASVYGAIFVSLSVTRKIHLVDDVLSSVFLTTSVTSGFELYGVNCKFYS